VAALATMLGIGLVLDAVGARPDGSYSLDAYRVALSVVAVPFLVGGVGLWLSARGVRAGQRAAVERSGADS